MPKVQFNIKNVHYAKMTPGASGAAPTYAKPVKVPGAVNLSLEQSGEVEEFFADGVLYYASSGNSGYSGDLEMALFPQSMLVDIWNHVLQETDGVLLEYADSSESNPFALLFEIDNDETSSRFCLYNCTGTKPGIASTTNTRTKTPQTQSSTITAMPREDNNLITARTTSTTTAAVRAGWFDSVYTPPATAEA